MNKAEKQVYLNGKWVADSDAKISIHDRGFTAGDAVYEAIRTFKLKPFRMQEHLQRLMNSLRVARIDTGLTIGDMGRIVEECVARNKHMFREGEDFKVYPIVSRGQSMKAGSATVIFTPKAISWSEYADFYSAGAHLVMTSVRKQPPEVYDAKIKSVSRFHHTLADMEAAQVDPRAYCLMLDMDGNVAENRSSNICIVRKGRIETPSPKSCLRGITTDVVFELAEQLGIPAVEKDIQLYDVINAEEVFLTATSFCVLPVTRLNSARIGVDQCPGPIATRLLEAFGQLVGVNVVDQALRMTNAGKDHANAA